MATIYKRGRLDKFWMPKLSRPENATFCGCEIDTEKFAAFVKSVEDATNRTNFSKDVDIWNKTIKSPSPQSNFLKRIFSILKWGPLYFRKKRSDGFELWPYPLAVALSHGGRVLIQLPRGDQRQQMGTARGISLADMVWKWLIGDVKPKQRWAATHGIDELLGKPETGGVGFSKWLMEAGTLAGSGLQHWGVNIALGGNRMTSPYAHLYQPPPGNRAVPPMVSLPDGRHGHVYLGYKRAVGKAHGGILIGVEGSEPGKWDILGHFHGPSGTSSYISMAGGIKFKKMGLAEVPKQADCMFVDLASKEAWERFRAHRNDTNLEVREYVVPLTRPRR